MNKRYEKKKCKKRREEENAHSMIPEKVKERERHAEEKAALGRTKFVRIYLVSIKQSAINNNNELLINLLIIYIKLIPLYIKNVGNCGAKSKWIQSVCL